MRVARYALAMALLAVLVFAIPGCGASQSAGSAKTAAEDPIAYFSGLWHVTFEEVIGGEVVEDSFDATIFSDGTIKGWDGPARGGSTYFDLWSLESQYDKPVIVMHNGKSDPGVKLFYGEKDGKVVLSRSEDLSDPFVQMTRITEEQAAQNEAAEAKERELRLECGSRQTKVQDAFGEYRMKVLVPITNGRMTKEIPDIPEVRKVSTMPYKELVSMLEADGYLESGDWGCTSTGELSFEFEGTGSPIFRCSIH